VIIVSSFFIFFRLGHYALWDDEANTALFAQSVWRTGDTYAMLDHNLIAHTNGQELKNLFNRYIPPLGFYLAAPFVGLAPGSALAARLPFAICGLLTILLMLVWLARARASVSTWLLMSAGILGNVSLMLYFRQCRYYSPAILATTALAFLYVFRDNRKRTLFSIALVSLLLLASNFMFYVAVYACLVVDYLFWGRKIRPLQYSDLAIIFIPQLIFGGLLISIYSLLGEKVGTNYDTLLWLKDKMIMVLWNIREINSCEHGVGILIALAPFLYFYAKDKRLLRCPLAIFTYAVAIAFLAPKPSEGYQMATVRYLAPVIPICIFTAVLSIQTLTARAKRLVIPLAILAFGTNVLHGGPLVGTDNKTMFSRIIAQGRFRSTVVEYVHELTNPPPSAYRTVADWINENLEEKETVWVMPSFATYPLMYHAPKVMYAWQLMPNFKNIPSLYNASNDIFAERLKKKREGQFRDLSGIHFLKQTLPDYAIAFGPQELLVRLAFKQLERELVLRCVRYVKIEQIDLYWYDLIRPELFWHSFYEIKNFSRQSQAIYIFKKLIRHDK